MVGTHNYAVLNDTRAEELAQALAAHGFAYVTSRPSRNAGWMVTVVDDGPYSVDAIGHLTIEAVARAAAAIARDHGGYTAGGSCCDVSLLPSIRDSDAPIVKTNLGARPPMPAVVVVPAPPTVPLP